MIHSHYIKKKLISASFIWVGWGDRMNILEFLLAFIKVMLLITAIIDVGKAAALTE